MQVLGVITLIVMVVLGVLVAILLLRLQSMDARMAEQAIAAEVQKSNIEDIERLIGDMRTGDMVQQQSINTMHRTLEQMSLTEREQLERMLRDISAVSTMSRDLGEIRRVLLNVKTNGNLGEAQLESILADILAPQQYESQFRLVPEERTMVDFAVRMPGDGNNPMYLVIDSKNPSISFAKLQEAYESGDRALCEGARKAFVAELRKEAADICKKYVKAPNSLDYGVMFLPSEAMYAEALRLGMVEVLRKESNVMIAGPSSMAALLSSFRVGFQMLAIRDRSEDIRRVLEEVRIEVDRFDEVLARAENHLEMSRKDITSLRTTRTNALKKKLEIVTDSAEKTS